MSGDAKNLGWLAARVLGNLWEAHVAIEDHNNMTKVEQDIDQCYREMLDRVAHFYGRIDGTGISRVVSGFAPQEKAEFVAAAVAACLVFDNWSI